MRYLYWVNVSAAVCFLSGGGEDSRKWVDQRVNGEKIYVMDHKDSKCDSGGCGLHSTGRGKCRYWTLVTVVMNLSIP